MKVTRVCHLMLFLSYSDPSVMWFCGCEICEPRLAEGSSVCARVYTVYSEDFVDEVYAVEKQEKLDLSRK